MREFVSKKAKSIPLSGIGEFFEIANSLEDIISLAVGEPDFDTPWHIKDETIYALKKNNTHYLEARGLVSLRKEICRFLRRKYSLEYNLENIMVTVGASEAIDLIFRTILDDGDEVIILEPCYVAYTPAILLSGGIPIIINLKAEEEFKLTKEALKKAISPKTKAILLNYPSNPTGGIMTKDDYQEIIEIIKEKEILVISDEIYAELTYETKHYSIARFKEIKEQILVVSGFSKAYSMTGFRIGYVAGNKDIITAMSNIHEYTIMCPTSFVEYAAIEALKHGDNDVEIMKTEFERRRNYVTNRLNKMGLSCPLPKGAFYVFFDITSTGLSSYDFAMKLVSEHHVAVVPGNAFGESGEGFIRISYASSMKELEIALNRIEEMLKTL